MLDEGQLKIKGEFVLAIEGQGTTPSSSVNIDIDQLVKVLAEILPGSQAADLAASLTGRRRNEIYRLMLAQRDGAGEE
jgi:16S rRNA (cytidine1402-2'-O)-methyltransferase